MSSLVQDLAIAGSAAFMTFCMLTAITHKPAAADIDELETEASTTDLAPRLVRQKSSLRQLRDELIKTHVQGIDHIDHLTTLYPPELLQKAKHLAQEESGELRMFCNPLIGTNQNQDVFSGTGSLQNDAFITDDYFVTADESYQTYWDIEQSIKFVKAGPRAQLLNNPKKTKVCIVTCGGLCPGLNVVIRELFMSLHYNYEVEEIYGIKWGYKGIYTDTENTWLRLTPDMVKNIHKEGGTMLGSSRGHPDKDKLLDELVRREITQVYIIGGDGTHKGINALQERCKERKLVIQFIGIPKTIDNDIPLIDYSFGFHTSVEVAAKMVNAALCEAKSVKNGVGLVKLMGRHSGFIAQFASLANNAVDFCLIPELPFELAGPKGLYEQIIKRVKERGHCLIVVAEGAEEGLINPNEHISKEEKHDASGNLIYDDVGTFLETAISDYGQSKGFELHVSFIDPTYAIRSVPASPADTLLCTKLAQHAVHGAMYGFTGFSTGSIRNSLAYIPVKTMMDGGRNRVNLSSRQWQRLLVANRQPEFVNDENIAKAKAEIQKSDNQRKECLKKIAGRVFASHQELKAD